MAYIQIYTGDGKGKTTAALGLSLRVLGNAGKVFFGQFIKGPKPSSEFEALKLFGDKFTHKTFGAGRFIKRAPSETDIKLAMEGLHVSSFALASGDYDMVVLDELNGAIDCGLFSVEQVLKSIKPRNPRTELVITGRNTPEQLARIADLISETIPVKHYFDNGVPARKGIEF
jgi:cob(I)alamin adenosyltransferase